MVTTLIQPTRTRSQYDRAFDLYRSISASADDQNLSARDLSQRIAEEGQLPLAIASAVVASIKASELRYWGEND